MDALTHIRNQNYGFRSGATTRLVKRYIDERQHRGRTSKEELKKAFHSIEKGIILVEQRILKKIIQNHKDIRSLAFHIPHTEEYLMATDVLIREISQLDPDLEKEWQAIKTPSTVLLSEPTFDELENFSLPYFGLKYWASLAHAETHKCCITLSQSGQLGEAKVKETIARIGIVEFEEIREVLAAENLLFNPKDNSEVLFEFLAHWVELYYFTPELWKKFFPSLKNAAQINHLFKELGLDFKEILTTSQPTHTPSVEELMFSVPQRENRSPQTDDVYKFKTHYERILGRLVELLPEEPKADVETYYKPIVQKLLNRCIQKDRILSILTFQNLQQEILWSNPPYKFKDLELLNEVFTEQLNELYHPLSAKELAVLKKRGDDFLEEIRENQKLKEVTEYTIKAFGSQFEELQEVEVHNTRSLAFFDGKTLILFVLYRWFFYLLRYIFPNSFFALKFQQKERLRSFKRNILKAKLYASFSNFARSLIYWRHALSLVEKTLDQRKFSENYPVTEKLQEQIQNQIQLFADQFVNTHELTSEQDKKTLIDLVEYLVERIEAKKEFGFERNLLFDLQFSYQKAIKQYFKLNFDGFFRSFGRNKLIAKLPFQQKINKIKYLRSVKKRIQKLKIRDKELKQFSQFVQQIIDKTNTQLKEEFNSILNEGFQKNQLIPQSSQEKVGFEKLKEELIDQMIERGRFRFSYLRDILSRNELKLPDLTLKLIVSSDQLLSLDKYFRQHLFGVYTGGEIYMRILQRLSSLLFGNLLGRFLTKFLLLPFLGAYIVLEGLDHTLGILIGFFIEHFHFYSTSSTVGLGLFLMTAINFEWGYTLLVKILKAFGIAFSYCFRGLKKLFFTKIFEFLLKIIFTPGLISATLTFALFFVYRELQPDHESFETFFQEEGVKKMMRDFFLGGMVFFNVLFYTFLGMALRDWLNQLIADTAWRLKKTLWVGLFNIIMEAFKSFLFYLEYVVYSVENATRFYEKEKKISLLVKGLFGVIWFWITYMIIIYINVLVEPQVNPIKHFPVVTVSHKLMLTVIVPLTKALEAFLLSLYIPYFIASPFAWLTILLLPGLFGFLVWEFKENWKLYYKNRSLFIKPVLVGSHGETLPRLLRKGFHSGTIPKLLKKIRQTGLQAYKTGDWSKLRKYNHDLEHVKEYLEMFVERELIANMKIHPKFMEPLENITTHEIYLTNNKMEIPLYFQKKSGEKFQLQICFEDVFSWILGSCSFKQETYSEFWNEHDKILLDVFLTIFFKKAGVEIIREQVEDTVLRRSGSLKNIYPNIQEQMKLSYEIYDNKAIMNLFNQQEKNQLHGTVEYFLFPKKNILPVLHRDGEPPYTELEPIPPEQMVFKRLKVFWSEMNDLFKKYENGEEIAFDTLRITRINQTRFAGIR